MVQSDVKIIINGDCNEYYEFEYIIWIEGKSNDLNVGTSYKIDKRAPYVKIIYMEWYSNNNHKYTKKSRVLKKNFYVHVIGDRNYVSVIIARLTKYGIKLDNISYEMKNSIKIE